MKIKAPIPIPEPSGVTDGWAVPDSRVRDAQLLPLVEINPALVVDRSITAAETLADDADFGGTMRESCPYCLEEPLQLVLRRKQVIRPHLFCRKCTRCFDVILPDGGSAFGA